MKIALINAHTSYSRGAGWNFNGESFNEYGLSRRINLKVNEILTSKGIANFIVDASEEKPYNKSLSYKAFSTNIESPTFAIETHFNSVSFLPSRVRGFEILYHASNKKSLLLAQNMVESFKIRLPFSIRRGNGLYERTNIYLLKAIECPSIIIEVCFLSNKVDRLFLLFPRAIDIIAYTIVDGIQTQIIHLNKHQHGEN